MCWVVWQQSSVPSSCSRQPMAKTQWSDAIMVLWFVSSKLPSSCCCPSGTCCIRLTLSSRMRLPCLKMGSGSRSSTSDACTYIANRNSSRIWMTRCAQKRQTDGHTFTACSSYTSCVNVRSSNTRTPMHTSNQCRPNGGQLHSSSR